MTDWPTITETQTDPGAPITSNLIKGLNDKPAAISEGADGSPYVEQSWHPYDGVTVGDGNDGLIWDHSVDGTSATIETPVFAAGYEYLIYVENLKSGGNTGTFTVDFYKGTDAAYQDAGTVIDAEFDAADIVCGEVIVSRPGKASTAHCGSFAIGGGQVAAPLQAFGALGLYDATSQIITKARLACDADFAAGKVYLLKRIDPLA